MNEMSDVPETDEEPRSKRSKTTINKGGNQFVQLAQGLIGEENVAPAQSTAHQEIVSSQFGHIPPSKWIIVTLNIPIEETDSSSIELDG